MNPLSTSIPARLSCEVPSDWYVKESLTLLAPDGSVNVIVSSEPLDLDGAIDSQAYATEQGRLLEIGCPGYQELEYQAVSWPSGCSAWFRRYRWCPLSADPVEQLQIYWVDRGRGYTGTATGSIASIGQADNTVMSILRSVRAARSSVETKPSRPVCSHLLHRRRPRH